MASKTSKDAQESQDEQEPKQGSPLVLALLLLIPFILVLLWGFFGN